VEIGRITVQGQTGQKVSKTPSQLIKLVWWLMPVIPVTGETVGKRIAVQGWLWAKRRHYPKK
jgi:hypothetical protein